MERRGFLAMLGLAPAAAVLPKAIGSVQDGRRPYSLGNHFCGRCGYMMYVPMDKQVVTCGNPRCPEYEIKYYPWRQPLERV